MPTETRTYTGTTGGPGGFDGYAGLILGTRYTGQAQADGRIAIALPSGRTTSVSAEEWAKWFTN